MKTFTIADIRSWSPCYDPSRHLPEAWSGNALDILRMEIPVQDKFWVVFREGIISDKTLRLFAVWSYRQTLAWIKDPDPRSVEAANVAERFASGEATEEELLSAASAARPATSASWSAARSATSAAASAAWSVAWSATSAAESASWSVAWSATSASWSAARSEEGSAQLAQLIKLLEDDAR